MQYKKAKIWNKNHHFSLQSKKFKRLHLQLPKHIKILIETYQDFFI